MREYVILVDQNDQEIGTAEKLQAHTDGLLHRAFSVFIFNARGELLLQQRHPGKYHSGGLWSNTCCGHPRPGETVVGAATRRLQEEMALHCMMETAFSFTYKVRLDDLWEHEYDHVLLGFCEREPAPDPQEVLSWRWMSAVDLLADLDSRPQRYTYWFRQICRDVLAHVPPGYAPG